MENLIERVIKRLNETQTYDVMGSIDDGKYHFNTPYTVVTVSAKNDKDALVQAKKKVPTLKNPKIIKRH